MIKKPRTAAFKALMPVHSFENDKVVFQDGRVAVGFRVEPAEMESWTADDYEAFQTALVGVLRPLPVGTIVQKTDVYYDRPYREDKTQQTYFEGKMNKHFFERLVLFQQSYLFLSFAPVAVKTPSTNAVNALVARAGEAVLKNPFAQLVHTLEAAESSAVEFIQGLQEPGRRELRAAEPATRFTSSTAVLQPEFDAQPTRQEREIGNVPGALSVGEHRVNILSHGRAGLRGLPGRAQRLRGDRAHALPAHPRAAVPARADAGPADSGYPRRVKQPRHRPQAQRLALVPGHPGQPPAGRRNRGVHGRGAGGKQADRGPAPLVLLWDTSDTSRRENVERATAAFRYMFGTQSVVESYLALPLFFGLLPGNAARCPTAG